jgi:hypothetical protein
MKHYTTTLVAIFALIALAAAATEHYPFSATASYSLSSTGGVPVPSPASISLTKQANDRITGLISFDDIALGTNEYYDYVTLEFIILASSSNNGRAMAGVIPVGSTDFETVTYDTLPRLDVESIDKSLANQVGNKIVLDVTSALEAKTRVFEIVIIGGGVDVSITLGEPILILHYPAWSWEPLTTNCQYIQTPVPGMTEPGVVSNECMGPGDDLHLYVHGAPTTDNMWDDVAPYMLEHGSVIMVNLPGNIKSGKIIIDSNNVDRAWGSLIVEKLLDWIHIRDFRNIHLVGQDMGGPVSGLLGDALAQEGRLAHLGWAEAVSTDQILCESDETDGCFTDGSPSNGNPFMTGCFALNMYGCADYILGYNWFKNASLVFDPTVYGFAAQIGGSPVLISYPFPTVENVYQILTTSYRPNGFYDDKYCDGTPCAVSPATQAETFWPRTLHTHGADVGQHSAWLRDANLAIRESLMNGALSTVPTTIYCADYIFFKTIVQCRESDVAWATGPNGYPNLAVNRFGGRMGHFFTEDGFSGAYSFARAQEESLGLTSA